MPSFDRTGPRGAGPMTGWARGLCGRLRGGPAAAASGPGRAWHRGGGGRGWGGGRGFGGGREAFAPATLAAGETPAARMDSATPAERRAALKAERNRLKSQLGEVEETLRAIGRETAEDPET